MLSEEVVAFSELELSVFEITCSALGEEWVGFRQVRREELEMIKEAAGATKLIINSVPCFSPVSY